MAISNFAENTISEIYQLDSWYFSISSFWKILNFYKYFVVSFITCFDVRHTSLSEL